MCSQATIFCGCRVSVYKQCWKTVRAKALLRIPFLSGTVNSLKTLARLLRLMNSTECRRCQPPSLETPVYDFFIITKETLFLRRRNRNAIDAKLTFFCFGSLDVSQSEGFFTPGSGSGIWWEGSWSRIPLLFHENSHIPLFFHPFPKFLFCFQTQWNKIEE